VTTPTTAASIRATQSADVPAIRAMTAAVGVFNAEEVATVDELLAEYFSRGAETSGYHFLSYLENDATLGFACYGPRALTQGVYDLFWIVTAPASGRRGIGGKLLAAVAEAVTARQGRMIVAETSGRADYVGTRAFYLRYGYRAEATIADFYAPGDDLVVFVYRLA
jgi:ribosomal protein S18 acetylase RimI-like enzyme